MAETPPGGPSYGQSASGFPGAPGQFSGAPGGPPSWPLSAPRGASRALTFISLGISVIATVLAIVGWFRPTHTAPTAASASPSTPTYTSEQVNVAKTNVCDAYALVKKVVSGNTHRVNPIPGDRVGDLATGIYAPVSLYDSGDYLSRSLLDNLAAPGDLAESVKSFSKNLFKLAMADLASDSDSALDSIRHQLDSDVTTIDGLCK
jgi:hypothetical protein